MTREEAIKIIESNCSCSGSPLREACAMFIPELRESYDERVRKNIVATIEQCPDDFLSPKNRDRMLAYLEKLKEQKPQEPQVFCEAKAYDLGYKQGKEDAKKEQKPKTFNEPYNPDEYEVIMEGNATSLRQKEQKPAEKQDYSGLNDLERAILRGFLCAGVKNVPVGIIKDTAYECMGFLALIEPKPEEWSEEDEKMLVHVVELLELNCDFSEINNEISWLKSLSRKKIWNKEDERILKGIVGLIDHNQHYDVSNKDMLNWLKSLRPQQNPKWSEDDEKNLELVTDCVYEFYPDPVMKYKLKDWLTQRLKSLRPSWKPSEEQMKAIESCFCEFGEGCPDEDGLRSLYNDLKKL